MIISQQDREQARALVAGRLGLDFRGRRMRNLERAIAGAALGDGVLPLGAYLARLAQLADESPEWRRLASDLTVCETYFFREHPCFEALAESILPPLIERRRAGGFPSLRLWSAGCSSGEEAYSLAILVDRLLPDRSDWAITILGTDVDVAALDRARRGVYREWSFRTLPAVMRERYFQADGDAFELDRGIKEMVTFEPLNLAADTYPTLVSNTTSFDVILCRNVLMYLTREAQQRVLARLQRALAPDGWLGVGLIEATVDRRGRLVPAGVAPGVFFRVEATPSSALRASDVVVANGAR